MLRRSEEIDSRLAAVIGDLVSCRQPQRTAAKQMDNFKNAPSKSLDRSRIADRIFKDLRGDIITGMTPQGAKLPSERELAQRYGVSGPTVREAIRGLTLLGLADVRHGSGAYVKIDTEALIADSLGTVIQLEKPEMAHVLGLSGILNEYAAGLAAQTATREDHARLHSALHAIEQATTAEAAARAVRNFYRSIAVATHNPLLVALCGFLVELQTELAHELVGNSIDVWQKLLTKLKPIRKELVEAVLRRDREAAIGSSRELHGKAVHFLTSLPKAKKARLTDPKLRQLLSLMMMTRVGPT